jgi:hypothetical protein
LTANATKCGGKTGIGAKKITQNWIRLNVLLITVPTLTNPVLMNARKFFWKKAGS